MGYIFMNEPLLELKKTKMEQKSNNKKNKDFFLAFFVLMLHN